MQQDKLKQEWLKLAPFWIKEAREGPYANRNGLLDAPMLEACGDVTGKKILECGCGEGRFCRMLAKRGAQYVLGIDTCEPMIEAAKAWQTQNDEYKVADAQNLHFLEDQTFDLAVSYLNQCDLPDVDRNNREVFRILKPGGRFIITNLHPMRSAVGGWQKNEKGEKEHAILDHYFDESERQWTIMGVELTNFHRSLATYINGFFAAGFVLERLIEPMITPENVKKYPELEDELRVPNFIVYVLRKP